MPGAPIRKILVYTGMLPCPVWSRLSFPATEPPDPRRVSEGFQGSLKGSPKGFRRVLEGF